MKILYTSDLHGEIRLYQQLLGMTVLTSPEVMILGGDILLSFPPSKKYKDMLPNQRAFIDQFLKSFFEKILNTTSIQQILLIPGNWDLSFPYVFSEPVPGVVDLTQKSYRLKGGYELIGYPFVPPTPFRPKDFEKMDDREAPWPPQKNPSYVVASLQTGRITAIDPYHYLRERETIEEDLDRLPKPLDPMKTVYVMHSPPFGTPLDLIQGGSAGSRSIRSFIERNQPLLALHGHIHESRELSGTYFDYIGKTLSINPGQSAWCSGSGTMQLDAVTFDMENVQGTLKHTRDPLTPSPACR